ncbi:MAG: SDR family oxidoreductase, partial [Anaerolineales bacterium]
SGLLGINLALEACKDYAVVGVVHHTLIASEYFQVIQADLTQDDAIDKLIETVCPDWIINCAALADLDACETNPPLAKKLNTDLPAKLATHVARGGARLLQISTDAVFDGQRGHYREEDEPHPLSVYAQTKLDGERAVLAIAPQSLVVRVNFFGWSLSGRRSLAEFFFSNLQAGKTVMGFTDVYFCPLLVNDLAYLLLQLMNSNRSGLYHVVAPQAISKYEFGVAIARQFGFDERLIQPTNLAQANLKAARAPNMTLDTSKLQRELSVTLPTIAIEMERFWQLWLQGYPTKLSKMRIR